MLCVSRLRLQVLHLRMPEEIFIVCSEDVDVLCVRMEVRMESFVSSEASVYVHKINNQEAI